MRVLVACEYSGRVRDEFISWGHYAMSCDFLASESTYGPHYQGDVFDIIDDGWDLMIAHPPCTYLCRSGLHWNGRVPGREEKTVEALEFVKRLLGAPIPHIALENPVGCIGTRWKKPDQYIQPYEFGDDASKKTGLWLKNLPLLLANPREYIAPRKVEWQGKTVDRWANQTDSGHCALGPSPDRWKDRSRTYPGIAKAMAETWTRRRYVNYG